MIQFFYENVDDQKFDQYIPWLENLITNENKKIGKITYIVCDDDYLLKINQEFLQHDYYTDIITFDQVRGNTINGDIFVSLQRILDNAESLSKNPEEETRRVLAHGVLHLCGYKDKTPEDEKMMRSKEDQYLNIFKK